MFARLPWQSMPQWQGGEIDMNRGGLIIVTLTSWTTRNREIRKNRNRIMPDVKALQCTSGHHAGRLHWRLENAFECVCWICLRTGAASLLSSSLERDTGRVRTAGLFTVSFLRVCGGQIVHKALYHILYITISFFVALHLELFAFAHLSFNAWLMLRLRCLNPWVHALRTNYACLPACVQDSYRF